MKAREVVEALRKRHGDTRQWVFFDELRVGTGYRRTWAATGHQPDNPEQRLDAWAMNMYQSKNFLRIAYEIKVTRSDFKHEINRPEKRHQALKLSNQYYFVVPKGLIKPEEIPEGAGLIEVNEKLETRVKVEAPMREAEPPTLRFIATIARRIAKSERAGV